MAAMRRLIFSLVVRRNLRRERIFRDRQNPFDVYDDVDLYSRFRFRREDIIYLCDMIADDIDHPMPRKGSLPPLMQMMVALRFYASGCFQIVIGDIFGIDRSTVSRIIERVSRAFNERLNEFVQFPTQEEAPKVMADFYKQANFPNVVGCLDCTHVRITAPSENEAEYVNRKGYHSINCQLICNADLIITNCVVNWPGSVHDSRILRGSNVWEVFERVPRPLPGILLGDSGYPLREWLMTPYTDPNTRPKERYNGAHRTTRSTIERTNGVLKKRWHCLHSELRCVYVFSH